MSLGHFAVRRLPFFSHYRMGLPLLGVILFHPIIFVTMRITSSLICQCLALRSSVYLCEAAVKIACPRLSAVMPPPRRKSRSPVCYRLAIYRRLNLGSW